MSRTPRASRTQLETSAARDAEIIHQVTAKLRDMTAERDDARRHANNRQCEIDAMVDTNRRVAQRLANTEQVAGVWRKSYETAEAERVALDAAFRALALRLAELERRAFTTQIDADVARRLQRDEARDEAEARR